jgi:uncharacterized RDD family membrane protein YckC
VRFSNLLDAPMGLFPPPLIGNLEAPVNIPPDRRIGSLWRRLVAAFIDSILVGIAGTVIAAPFFDFFSRLGAWGRLVGFCLALPYFVLMNSRVGNGQTLGKRVMHLQVAKASGEPISASKSFMRYLLLSAPFFVNYLRLPVSRTPQIAVYLLGAVFFGLGGITAYLVLFNRQTRQGVHDLAAGSYVADADKSGPLAVHPIWRGHWAILGALVVAAAIGGPVLESKLTKLADFPAMLSDARVVENMDHVQSASVSDLTWTPSSGAEKKTIYVVNVFWSGQQDQQEAFAKQVASRILENDPHVADRDLLRIVIIRGYDLGIASAQRTNPFEDSPANWKAKLQSVAE